MAYFIYFSLVSFSKHDSVYGCMCTFLWWPILYTYILLDTYSARTEIFDGYFVHILPHVLPILDKYHVFILIRTLVTFVAFFIFFSWRHIMSWPRPYLWWSILYTYLDRVTYFVHMVFFDGFLYTYLPPRWSTTTSWVRFYTIALYNQFCIVTSS